MASEKRDSPALPSSVRRRFGWLFALTKLIERNYGAFIAEPTTAMDRLTRTMITSLENRVAEVGKEGILRDLCSAVDAIPPAELAKSDLRMTESVQGRRRKVARHPEGAALLALMEAAHQSVRNAPLLAVPNQQHGMAKLTAHARIFTVSGNRGETRGRLVLDAYFEVVEGVYRSYLEAIWKLVHLVDAAVPPPAPNTVGRLLRGVQWHLHEGTPLLESDAAHVRNAIAHRRFSYLPDRHAFELRDGRGWTCVLTVKELEAKTRRMLRVAGELYETAATTFMEEALVRPSLPIYPEFCRAVLRGDDALVQQIARDMNARADAAWTELRALYDARAPTT